MDPTEDTRGNEAVREVPAKWWIQNSGPLIEERGNLNHREGRRVVPGWGAESTQHEREMIPARCKGKQLMRAGQSP